VDQPPNPKPPATRWLNRTVLGIALASLFSDWAHETATSLLPAFLASLHVAAAWLGLIEGISDGLASVAKMASGFATDRLTRRQPVAALGYLMTALGTASFALATSAWHVLFARASAWLGRGVRTPIRKALLAGSVTPETYGRAFGFERMMDTIGAIAGPASALILLPLVHQNYRVVFGLTLIPGLIAAALISVVVKEKERKPVPHITLAASLRSLPPGYRKFLAAAGLFGAGDFARTLLLLLAAQTLTPSLGAPQAAAAATALYILHNILSATASGLGGRLADRVNKGFLLAGAYGLAVLMALVLVFVTINLISLIAVFTLAGLSAGLVETLEDSFCAELVGQGSHGVAFGLLATVNGLGDFVSSAMVGLLWSAFTPQIAFAWSGILALGGTVLVLRSARRSGRPGGLRGLEPSGRQNC
jgi:MFS family permease